MSEPSGRIPSLDGLRAVSILMVLYGHASGTRGFPQWDDPSRWFGDLAHLGVIVFFVLSGFLITSLLMSERQKTGTISMKGFYLRRVLRILPASYAFILAMVIVSCFGWVHMGAQDIGYALTYTVNYFPQRSWVVGHLWSLSNEEQFYLLWPVLFLLLRKRYALMAAVAGFIMGPVVRAAMHLMFQPHSPWRDLEIFPATVDNIAIGCILAMLRPWLLSQGWYLRVTASYWLWLTLPLVFVINRFLGYTLVDLIGSPVMLICLAVLIEASTRQTHTLIGRVLNWKPVAFLGVLSYSLYLWQQPFLDRYADSMFNAFPLNVLLAVLAALLSYFLIERPFLGMRRRLERSTRLPKQPVGVNSDATATPSPHTAATQKTLPVD